MLIYGLLHLTGYDLSLEVLKRYRKWGGTRKLINEEVVVYNSGPIGRLNADDVLTLVRHYKQNRN